MTQMFYTIIYKMKSSVECGEKGDEKINYKNLLRIIEGFVPELIDASPKMIVLFQIIHSVLQQNDKIIIFSQSLLTLNMIEKCLQVKLNWKKNLHYYSK